VSLEECLAYWRQASRATSSGYAIQGSAPYSVESLSGSYSGVMACHVRNGGTAAGSGIAYWCAGERGARLSIEICHVAPRERAQQSSDRSVAEIYVERTSRRGLVSNLYKGRVSRVLLACSGIHRHRVGANSLLHVADIANSRT